MKPETNNTYCHYPFRSIAMKTWDRDRLVAAWPCCMMGNIQSEGVSAENIFPIESVDQLTPQEIYDHPRMAKLRHNLSNGRRDPACRVCWQQESRGLRSFRQFSNHAPHHQLSNTEFNSIDLTLSTVCNLRCRMCTTGSSNSLVIDRKLFEAQGLLNSVQTATKGFFDHHSVNSAVDSIQFEWLMANTDRIRHIRCSGGEPFHDRKIFLLLDRYIQTGAARETVLNFHTNGTLITDAVLEKLQHFKIVECEFSVDGVDRVYNYIRYPAEFTTVNHNIVNYAKLPVVENLRFNMVVSAHNIFNIPDYIRWIDSVSEITGKPVSAVWSSVYPARRGIALNNVSVELLQTALEEIQSVSTELDTTDLENLVRSEIKNHRGNAEQLAQETILFDRIRDQHYADYIDPRMAKYISSPTGFWNKMKSFVQPRR